MSGDLRDITKGFRVRDELAVRRLLENMAKAAHGSQERLFHDLLSAMCGGDIYRMAWQIGNHIKGTNMSIHQWLADGNIAFALELLRRNPSVTGLPREDLRDEAEQMWKQMRQSPVFSTIKGWVWLKLTNKFGHDKDAAIRWLITPVRYGVIPLLEIQANRWDQAEVDFHLP